MSMPSFKKIKKYGDTEEFRELDQKMIETFDRVKEAFEEEVCNAELLVLAGKYRRMMLRGYYYVCYVLSGQRTLDEAKKALDEAKKDDEEKSINDRSVARASVRKYRKRLWDELEMVGLHVLTEEELESYNSFYYDVEGKKENAEKKMYRYGRLYFSKLEMQEIDKRKKELDADRTRRNRTNLEIRNSKKQKIVDSRDSEDKNKPSFEKRVEDSEEDTSFSCSFIDDTALKSQDAMHTKKKKN